MGTAQTVVAATDSTKNTTFTTMLGGNWYKGYMMSEIIGPNSMEQFALGKQQCGSYQYRYTSTDTVGVHALNSEHVCCTALLSHAR